MPDPDIWCFDFCYDNCLCDYDCRKTPESSKNAICCRQPTCGNICIQPTEPITCDLPIKNQLSKRCPPQSNMQCLICNDQCTKNSDCPKDNSGHNQICCPQTGCGNQCKQPTPVSVSGARSRAARF